MKKIVLLSFLGLMLSGCTELSPLSKSETPTKEIQSATPKETMEGSHSLDDSTLEEEQAANDSQDLDNLEAELDSEVIFDEDTSDLDQSLTTSG